MRFVVFGAGAVGGVIGGRLAENGHDVVLVARGENYEAIARQGLVVESQKGEVTIDAAVVDDPASIDWGPDDAVILSMKSQDTAEALNALSNVAPPATPIFCAQNGVDNERMALRRFRAVYGVCVMCPTAHLVPGRVQAFSYPLTGMLDLGRYPTGVDDVAREVSAA
ncbi:MAG TPA: 2-dehydropantoate 2-reductase, partial [Acidimicrobiales bacterium]|nr:2-dehydropantoate 2-reductase [Acidimicrobiales bacterium]